MSIKAIRYGNSIKLYQEDAYDFMQKYKIDGNSLFITDPPYGITKEINFHTLRERGGNVGMNFDKNAEHQWDHNIKFDWIKLIPNMIKDNTNVVIFNCWENLGLLSDLCKESKITVKRSLVLSKLNPSPFNCKRMFVNDVEFAVWGIYSSKSKPTGWTFNSEKMRDLGRHKNLMHKCVLETTVQKSIWHPTMKDIKIMKYLIELLSEDDATIIDPFGGSMTTACAVIELNQELENSNRKFIGCERETAYFDKACERIETTYNLEKNIILE